MNQKIAKKKSGCFFYGCLIIFLCFVLISVSTAIIIMITINKFYEYTQDKPLKYIRECVSEDKLEEFKTKTKAFYNCHKNKKYPCYLSLSSRELNTIIYNYEGFHFIKNCIQIAFEDNKVKSLISIPLYFLPFGIGSDRYLNAWIALNVKCQNGNLEVSLDSLELPGGDKLPEFFISIFKDFNFVFEMNNDKNFEEFLKSIKEITINENKMDIVLEPANLHLD